MHRIDGEGATVDNKFTKGNPSNGTPATVVTDDWLNAIQEEIVGVLSAAGLVPVKANNGQLAAAIAAMIAGGGVAVTAAGVSVADVAAYFGTDNVEAALAQLAQKVYAGTFTSNVIRRSIRTSNVSTSSAAGDAENIVEVSNAAAVTYTLVPDATWNAPIGTSIHVAQTGVGAVTITPGAGVTIQKPAAFNAKTLGQHATVVAYKVAANTWRLGGMLEAV